MATQNYKTKSRAKILEFLKDNSSRSLSVADIQKQLEFQEQKVNITTIYRYLDKLTQEGTINKYTCENGKQSVYQFVDREKHCHEHLHMQCVMCGEVLHLDCHFMEEIKGHVESDHGFQIQCDNSMIYGKCKKCQG